MKNLIVSYFYKLRHDIGFKIVLIIGVALSFLLSLLYFLIGKWIGMSIVSGTGMYLSSLSPIQNFGIAIPINLVIFTVSEFSHGAIRNKIISGHSKGKLYLSLFLDGLILTFVLLSIYALLSFAFGSMFGGFDSNELQPTNEVLGTIMSKRAPDYVWKMTVMAVFCYISIVSLTIFISTLFRNIGACIPVILILLMFLYLFGSIISAVNVDENIIWLCRIFDPLYGLGAVEEISLGTETITIDGHEQVVEVMGQTIKSETFISGLISNAVYATIFYVAGVIIFKKRDIK